MILNIEAKQINSADIEDTITSILLQDELMVLDIGANKTTTMFIEALRNTGLYNTLDLIAIPITDGEQDVLNAKSIYTSIRRMSKDIPIIFVLSRHVKDRDIEIQFDSFFEILLPTLRQEDKHYITMIDSDAIKNSKKISKTIYEMSLEKINFDEIFKKALQENKPKSELLAITKQRRMYVLAKDYRIDVLNSSYEKLDKIL
jgi:hypothetical protein